MTTRVTRMLRRTFTLTVTAGLAAACSDNGTAPSNNAPTAMAGADVTAGIFSTVTLTGSGTDPDGDALTYAWSLTSQPSGSSATLSAPVGATTTLVPDAEGTFVARLSVSDGTATATDDVNITVTSGSCDAAVDAFPVPVNDATSIFSSVDDDFLEVAFRAGFEFSFYGSSSSSVFLNTNGVMTFGGGDDESNVDVSEVFDPGIAVFWGDLDAAEYSGANRANQMGYQACDDRFIVTYDQMQDNDEEFWNNTATATLFASGRIVIEYGTVVSEDILVGVFDGTHTNDQYLAVAGNYSDYPSLGTGVILFDDWGSGPSHAGELDDQTIIFDPQAPAALQPGTVLRPVIRRDAPRSRAEKPEKR